MTQNKKKSSYGFVFIFVVLFAIIIVALAIWGEVRPLECKPSYQVNLTSPYKSNPLGACYFEGRAYGCSRDLEIQKYIALARCSV